jgi:hypothetical protein
LAGATGGVVLAAAMTTAAEISPVALTAGSTRTARTA